MASSDRYWSGMRVGSALSLSCSATVVPALILNHWPCEGARMKLSRDWSQGCRIGGVVSLEKSHALVAVLFSSMKFVLNFSSRRGSCAVSILIMVCIPQLFVDCCEECFA